MMPSREMTPSAVITDGGGEREGEGEGEREKEIMQLCVFAVVLAIWNF